MIKRKGNNRNEAEDMDTISQRKEEINRKNPKRAMESMKVGKNKKGAQQINHLSTKITKFIIFFKSKWEHMQT